jgi:hypothetical protein
MSKPRKKIRASACDGKRAFDTEEAASAAAKVPWKMLSRIGFMSAYKCRRCKKYHYGHPPK